MWLDPSCPYEQCFNEIQQSKAFKHLTFYEVGDLVNSVKNDKEECLLRKKEYEEKLHKQGLGRYFTKVPKVANEQES